MLYQSGRLGVVMAKMVRDVIRNRKEVYSISNQATVAEAARYLKDRHIRAAGVCNLSGKVIGVISQSDISDKVVAENYRPSEVMVQAVSSQNLVKIDAESSCQEAACIMNDKGIYHLVVEDAGGTFLGMISLRDCTMMRAEEESERADMLKDYAFPRY
jgi:predicted transcriptional regulator